MARPRSSLSTSRPRPRRQGVETALEGAATEFALLSQRRSRLSRQLELLRRQHDAAAMTMAQVMSRMAVLADRIGVLVPAEEAAPSLPARPQPQAEKPPPAPAPRRRGVTMTY